MTDTKPFDISKRIVWEAYKRVKANKGAAGVDQQSLVEFEQSLAGNLYRIWNRMSSGSYFPPPVRAVAIPKKSGGERILGVPTVADRIAQTVVTLVLNPVLEPHFHENSYGYRQGKSAHQAVEVTRKRCWKNDWVLEYDIRGLFDHIDHGLLMKALRYHTNNKWVLLYVQRWLTAPMQKKDGSRIQREVGSPQGGPLSPVLSNLFLHYALDNWLATRHKGIPFCRYADDGIIHCRTRKQAVYMHQQIAERLNECGLEIHPDKTRIVYCKDANRTGQYENIQFDFLGFTFRPRKALNSHGRAFLSFGPAPSGVALKSMRQTIRRWHLHLKSAYSLSDLAKRYGPVIQGWMGYYCRFRSSAFQTIRFHLDKVLVRWAMRKFKRMRRHKARAVSWLREFSQRMPDLFPHWQVASVVLAGSMGAR